MSDFGITEKSYQLLLNTFTGYPQVEKVIIFGSRAKGTFKRGSDIDLAIQGEACDDELALSIAAYINEELPIPYTVDVVNYYSLHHQELKEHIDRVGAVFFSRKEPVTH